MESILVKIENILKNKLFKKTLPYGDTILGKTKYKLVMNSVSVVLKFSKSSRINFKVTFYNGEEFGVIATLTRNQLAMYQHIFLRVIHVSLSRVARVLLSIRAGMG